MQDNHNNHDVSWAKPWYEVMTSAAAMAAPTGTYRCLSRFVRGERHWDDFGLLPEYERASFLMPNPLTGEYLYPGAVEVRAMMLARKRLNGTDVPAVITFDYEEEEVLS